MADMYVRPMTGITEQNGEGSIQVIKPAEWANYMVDAVLKVVSDENLPLKYHSDNEGKLSILNSLNYHEVHDLYAWPDFTSLGYDFANNMRLRRALVHDVYVALEKSGRLQVGTEQVVTPPRYSDQGKRRTVTAGSTKKAKQCVKKAKTQREDGDDVTSDYSERKFGDEDEYLADRMRELIGRSRADVRISNYVRGDGDVKNFVDIIHDALVEVWDEPQAHNRLESHNLVQKARTWAALAETEADNTNSDKDSTISVLESLRKRQGREMSMELGGSSRFPHSIP